MNACVSSAFPYGSRGSVLGAVWFCWIARDSGGSRTVMGYDGISRLASITHDLDAAGTSRDLTIGFAYNPASQVVTRAQSNDLYEQTVAATNRAYATSTPRSWAMGRPRCPTTPTAT